MSTGEDVGVASGALVAGRYRLRELVGKGGMGSVWRATDELLGREVAIKQVRMDLQPPDDERLTRERTMREARIAAALHHPNVVSIFDVVTDGGQPWLVLEYLPSRSLGSILAQYGALHPAHVAHIGAQVAAGLAAAHAAGIVHRDVKPDNILIARPPGIGEAVAWPGAPVKLTDFGISHAAATPTLTSTGVLTGTPAYFAPETARGEGTDARRTSTPSVPRSTPPSRGARPSTAATATCSRCWRASARAGSVLRSARAPSPICCATSPPTTPPPDPPPSRRGTRCSRSRSGPTGLARGRTRPRWAAGRRAGPFPSRGRSRGPSRPPAGRRSGARPGEPFSPCSRSSSSWR